MTNHTQATVEEVALLPCPFCGNEAEIERRGDHRVSTIYQCTFCGCSLETGEEWSHGRDWNNRAAILALPSVGWRTDMENAPRDGTRFQGGMFDSVGGSFRQFVCFWNPGWKGVEGVSDAGPFWQGGGLLEHPTHWRELLPPPPQPVEDRP